MIGLLAYGLANMAGVAGYGGWRWIFIIEGLITVVVGAACKFWIADWPEDARFLNERERALLAARLHEDGGEAKMNRLDKGAAKRIFSDWKIYVACFMYFGVVNTGYAGSVSILGFLPTPKY
jgi:sugar phosphate permease